MKIDEAPATTTTPVVAPSLTVSRVASGASALRHDAAAVLQLTVDLSRDLGPHRQHDVGFLHGFPADGFMSDPQRREWLLALKPRNWRTWATPKPVSGNYNSFDNYQDLRDVGVTTIQASCSDYSIFKRQVRAATRDEFIADCREMAARAKREGKVFEYDIINEGNLGEEAWMDYWVAGAQAVRLEIPDAVLIGPSHVNTLKVDFAAFLDAAHAGGVYPDRIAYHEFRGSARIAWEVDRIRAHARARGYPDRPVIISEFWPTEQDTDAPISPAAQVAFLAAGQRAGVSMNYAVNNCNDTINHLLDVRHHGTKRTLLRNALYWVHRAFVEMEGRSCRVEASDHTRLDGFAVRDAQRHQVRMLIGSPYRADPGCFQVRVTGIAASGLPVQQGLLLATVRKIVHKPAHDHDGFAVPVVIAAEVRHDQAVFDLALERFQACELVIDGHAQLPVDPVPGELFELRNVHTGQSLNVRGSSPHRHVGIEQFPYVPAPSMHWRGERDAAGWWTFTVQHSSQCLTVAEQRHPDDDPVVQGPADGTAAQRWRIEPLGPGRWRLLNANGQALAIEGGYQSFGVAAVLATPGDDPSQGWQVIPVDVRAAGTPVTASATT